MAEQFNICWRATHMIDAICNQVLRATVDQELIIGPDTRLQVTPNGLIRAETSRWPILQLVGASVASALGVPITYTTLPSGNYTVESGLFSQTGTNTTSATGAGPQAVRLAPGWIDWRNGRNGYYLLLEYLNGWPHAGCTIASSVSAGVTSLPVDDVTGMIYTDPTGVGTGVTRGAQVYIYDGANTEQVQVASISGASQDSNGIYYGPGTLTFTASLANPHNPGCLVSALPATVQLAALYLATSEALTRGASATTVQALPGSSTALTASSGQETLVNMAKMLLNPYKRVL